MTTEKRSMVIDLGAALAAEDARQAARAQRTPPTPADLQALREAHAAATPGPYYVEESDDDRVHIVSRTANPREDDPVYSYGVACTGPAENPDSLPDARYIALACNAVPGLVEEVERLREQRATALGLGDLERQALDVVRSERDRLRARVAELEARERWVPVGERLPEHGDRVRFWFPARRDGGLEPGEVTETMPWGLDYWRSKPSHWRPLPEPPEGE